MAGLPKLPGLTFYDPTNTRYHLSHTFDVCKGYRIPKSHFAGIGGKELECNTVKYIQEYDPVRYDPSLTYGKTRSPALPQYIPHFALYDQKCLTFKAFFKQSVVESPIEFYRVRHVNIIYFLEDDSITVMEPRVINSGLEQGRLVRRARIPKTDKCDYWHWKDLAVGKDICIYGVVYHTVDCDTFTREFMASQGLTMGDPEEPPPDPYTQERMLQTAPHVTKTPPADDKLRRFLEYDGKILRFKAIWDDRDSEYGEVRKYEALYILATDHVVVKEMHDRNDGRDPYPLLLRKTKLPKIYTDRPVTFPSVYLETSENEVTEYYQPKDFLVGETIFVLGRRLFLYDCDDFTRNYYRKVLCIEQKPPIDVEEKKVPSPEKKMPPHDGIGSLEDSLQNTLTFLPKPPKKDVVRQILNANKYLRYEMVMDAVHPEDTIRKFLLLYSLGDGTCKISEPPIRNSGILGGKYLRATLILKPGCDPLNPDYYTPADFYIGATIIVFGQRFKITSADLYVYRYMQSNPDKFPPQVIENMRNYMFNMGYLKDDLKDQIEDNCEEEKKMIRDAIGQDIPVKQTNMEKCLEEMKTVGDPEYEKAKRQQLVDEYEKSLEHKYVVPPHGIESVNNTCAYPVHIGDVHSSECKEEPEGAEGQQISSYTPKHIDTSEEKLRKYYAKVLKKHHNICEHGKPVECEEQPKTLVATTEKSPEQQLGHLMVSAAEMPASACKTKSVRFVDGKDRCLQDKYDLCNLKMKKDHCDCTQYDKIG